MAWGPIALILILSIPNIPWPNTFIKGDMMCGSLSIAGRARVIAPGSFNTSKIVSNPIGLWMTSSSSDIPTMVRHVQEATGFQKIHFIGHSLGGMLLYMVLMTMGNQVCQSAVTLGASMNSTARPGWIRLVLKLDWLLERFPLIPTKLLFRLGSPFVSWVAPLEDNHFYSIKNITPSLLQKA